jgi:Centromere/kinetochore Zw10.
MELVCEVLDEAVQSTDFCAVRLFCTARNIFELYTAVVPTHHKKFLETIPQQVGKFAFPGTYAVTLHLSLYYKTLLISRNNFSQLINYISINLRTK